MSISARITCVCFPTADRAFARYVEELLPVARSEPGVLQERLRTAYPSAVVRRRDLSAEAWETWYVYRDGTAVAAFGDADWWQQPGVGRLRQAGPVIVEANDEIHESLGYPAGSLVGQPGTVLLMPQLESDVAILRAIFAETGVMESTLPIRSATGEPVVMEHRTVLESDGSATSLMRVVSVVERRAATRAD